MITECSAALALVLSVTQTTDAATADARFTGGGYDGYGRQDTGEIQVPAPVPRGTMISFK